jgi:hypothetical protein
VRLIILLLLTAFGLGYGTAALGCSQPLPFAGQILQTELPQRPSSPVTGGELESHRGDWESARERVIEGYNRRLKAYGDRLVALDAKVQREELSGICAADAARLARERIIELIDLVRTDYQFVYDEAILKYKAEIAWYLQVIEILRNCKSLGGCEDGVPI